MKKTNKKGSILTTLKFQGKPERSDSYRIYANVQVKKKKLQDKLSNSGSIFEEILSFL